MILNFLNLKLFMELLLTRTYLPFGTNGEIKLNNVHICFCIELPWKQNKKEVSCIPEGRYQLRRRCSEHFGWHFELLDIPSRALILMHPANNAQKELKGCLAPVTEITGQGEGFGSKESFNKLKVLLYPVMNQGEEVWLRIEECIESIYWRRENGLWRNYPSGKAA
jgi:hypothetical protein